MMLGLYNDAIYFADESLKINPKHHQSLYIKCMLEIKFLAKCLFKLGKYDASI